MADEKKEAKEGEAAEAEAKPKGKGKLIIIIAVVVLLAGGVGGFLLMGGKKAPEGEAAEAAHSEEDAAKHYASVEIEPFIVNLSETGSFLKVKILVEFDPEVFAKADHSGHAGGGGGGSGAAGGGDKAASTVPPLMSGRMPMIRDSIIKVLSSKKAAEVLSLDGKEQIKDELVEAINQAIGLDESPVVAIYFIEFIVQ